MNRQMLIVIPRIVLSALYDGRLRHTY